MKKVAPKDSGPDGPATESTRSRVDGVIKDIISDHQGVATDIIRKVGVFMQPKAYHQHLTIPSKRIMPAFFSMVPPFRAGGVYGTEDTR